MKDLLIRKPYRGITTSIKRRPLSSFFVTLGLLFAVIIVGHIVNKPKTTTPPQTPVKEVTLYSIGQAPKTSVQAKVEKSGVVKIVALAGGVVQKVNVKEGAKVTKGKQILTLSTNYQGGNAPAIQASIAQKQYQNVVNTFDTQQQAIQKQRDIANSTRDNFTEQQNIAKQSASDTSALIDSNQVVLDYLNSQLNSAISSGAPSPTTIPQLSSINTLQGAQNTIKASLRSLQQTGDSGKPPNKLADSQKDLTLAQLDIQQKALELNKEVTGLQAALAQVNAATMLPASPMNGVVDRVFVHVGQQVSPGTVLASITSTSTDLQTTAVADVPQEIAQNVSKVEPSVIHINNESISVTPYYVSADATNGMLYSVFYVIPADYASYVTDGQFVKVDMPIGSVDSGAAVPFVPIDAVYQTQDENYVLVAENNKAISRQVTLGNVFGSYIQVAEGLHSGDQVILERNVVAGDKIKFN